MSNQQIPATTVQLRLPGAMAKDIDDYRRGQPILPSQSAAIRAIIELGLDALKAKTNGNGRTHLKVLTRRVRQTLAD